MGEDDSEINKRKSIESVRYRKKKKSRCDCYNLFTVKCRMQYYMRCLSCMDSGHRGKGRSKQQAEKRDYNQEKGDAGIDVDCRSGHCKKKEKCSKERDGDGMRNKYTTFGSTKGSLTRIKSSTPEIPSHQVSPTHSSATPRHHQPHPPPSPPHPERTAHQE